MNRIDTFLCLFCLIYLSAFASLLIQSKGLYGSNGILPSRIIIANNDHLAIRRIFGDTNVHSDDINVLIILGVVISSFAFIFPKFQTKFVFSILWICYFCVYQIGQTFLWFQWDILLLETGVIVVILAENWFYGRRTDDKEDSSSSLGFWLVKWLIFRLMFASGVVKLLSDCPTWWSLTALNWHYESQCIPTSLAWYAHQLPTWFQKLSVTGTFIIEISVPILFFIPIKPLQLFCFWCQTLFQVCIILSGNYNFFNFLTIALCFSLLPRRKNSDKSKFRYQLAMLKKQFELVITIFILIIVLLKSGQYFGVQLNKKKWILDSEIKFTRREFHEFLNKFVPITIYVGLASMILEIARLYLIIVSKKGVINKINHFISVTFTSVIVSLIFFSSLVPYTQIEQKTGNRLPENVKNLYSVLGNYEIVNSYGLFRRMTGVGGRPEIVIEGSNSVHGPWKEYEFLYKPGNISRAPPFLVPHQPRLDWQMWFAALGSYEHNPWLLNLLYRLLTNEPSVIQLLARNPFPQAAPDLVRIRKYTYRYTKFNNNAQSMDWWIRVFENDYLPPISLRNPGFMKYIQENNIDYREKNQVSGPIRLTTKWIIDHLDQSAGHLFVWIVLTLNLLTKFLSTNISLFF